MAKDIKELWNHPAVKAVYKPGHGPDNEAGVRVAEGILKTSKHVQAERERRRARKQ